MKKVMIAYGCGGHRSQANRLASLLTLSSKEPLELFTLTDIGEKPDWSVKHLELKEFRDKYSGKIISLSDVFSQVIEIGRFIKSNGIKNVISLGPGVCILACLVGKVNGCFLIHIETWSKFETLTFTTRVNRLFVDLVLFQNKELAKLLPRGKYVGRL